MAYEESTAGVHHLTLEDRERLTVSGVEEVESFDEATIVMVTAQGVLVVRGEGLHIEKLSLDGGDLKVDKGLGEISPDEFKHFIGKDMRLEQVSLRKTDLVKELLEFYMGKNTMERQNFIIDNLVIEEDIA